MKVLILHGYRASNLGDGLLVDEAVDIVREALPDAEVTVGVQYPETFELDPSIEILATASTPRRFAPDLLPLRRRMGTFDLVLGVGGGYLRAGHPMEALKSLLAHGPQLALAARSEATTVYLPQSVGPFRLGSARVFRSMLRRLDRIYLRDDRSVGELATDNIVRFPDLALLTKSRADRRGPLADDVPVLTVRNVRGSVPTPVLALADRLGSFDGFIQSTGGGNDDTAAMESLHPRRILDREELYGTGAPRRVVVAVRLHAALLAVNAGHWVVHLAYERKGFGAFADLGLPGYVHNVNDFDPPTVHAQIQGLLSNSSVQNEYDAQVDIAAARLSTQRERLVADLRALGLGATGAGT